MTQMTAIPAISDLPIYNTLMANRSSALLSVAVSLGLFDAIASCSATEIVNASWVKAKYEFSLRGADALLVGLKCLNLLESLPTSTPDAWYDIQYQLTPLSRFYLLSNSEHYLGHLILMDAESFLTPQGLLEAFKKDKPVVYGGQDPWEHQEADSASAERFTLGMRSISITPAIAMSTDKVFEGRKVLLDVGGGSGVHLAKILQANAPLSGMLLDIPSVFKTTDPYFVKEGVRDRIEGVKSDMFKSDWPKENSKGVSVDCILLSQILHDWPVNKGYHLLKSAFKALSPGGIVIIHEKLLDDARSGPVATAMVSLDMLFWTEGQQYTKSKLFGMLQEVGFVEPTNRSTVGYWTMTMGRKP